MTGRVFLNVTQNLLVMVSKLPKNLRVQESPSDDRFVGDGGEFVDLEVYKKREKDGKKGFITEVKSEVEQEMGEAGKSKE